MSTAFSLLGTNAQKAITEAQKDTYDAENYKFGDLVPTYSFAADPLNQECLSKIEIYKGTSCDGEQINADNWNNIVNNLNLVSRNSSFCLLDYDIENDGNKFDFKV